MKAEHRAVQNATAITDIDDIYPVLVTNSTHLNLVNQQTVLISRAQRTPSARCLSGLPYKLIDVDG